METKDKKNKKIEHDKIELILNYRASIESIKEKSHDAFEKSIYLLASGGLVVSLFVVEKVVDKFTHVNSKWMFILGLIGFIVTLLSNLLSHKQSIKESEKLINLINKDPECIFEEEYSNTLERGNYIIEIFNYSSIIGLIIGSVFILLFFIINFFQL